MSAKSFEPCASERARNWADNPSPPYDLPPMQVPTQREKAWTYDVRSL